VIARRASGAADRHGGSSVKHGPGAPTGTTRRIRSAALRMLLLGGLLLLAPAMARAQSADDARADMLFNLARFVDWPYDAPGATLPTLNITILGEDDLAGTLAMTLSSKSLNGRRVFVRFVRRVQDIKDSPIVFVAASEQKSVPEVIETLRDRSILTVSDVAGFSAAGGVVDFAQEGDKVRLEINQSSAERARLKISAKLLAVAKIVASGQ
jgi:hypothetical protein